MGDLSRRVFLGALGSGVVASALGVGVAKELERLSGLGLPAGDAIDFGALEPLVALMQETDPDALLPKLKARLDKGTSLETLVAAGALANARTFGGEDYVGYHCFMALAPSLEMARRAPKRDAALPVFKVLYRNATRIQQRGGRSREVLRAVAVPKQAPHADPRQGLLEAGRTGNHAGAEALLAHHAAQDKRGAFASLHPLVRDNIDVHQVVLAYRSWDMLQIAGAENAYVMMRQTMRQCIQRDSARRRRGRGAPSLRTVLPALMDKHGLQARKPGTARLAPAALKELAACIFACGRDEAAAAVAETLAKGTAPADVGEALSMAAVALLLHDRGSTRAQAGKPVGTVHGASVGVHAADAAHAWRGMATIGGPADAFGSLIAGAWHTAGQVRRVDPSQVFHASAREAAAQVKPAHVLGALGEAVTGREQARAAALVERAAEVSISADDVIAALLPHSTSQDGALHNEKYFVTATTEFARTRAAHRWQHLGALARVNASAYGFASKGYDRAAALFRGTGSGSKAD